MRTESRMVFTIYISMLVSLPSFDCETEEKNHLIFRALAAPSNVQQAEKHWHKAEDVNIELVTKYFYS